MSESGRVGRFLAFLPIVSFFSLMDLLGLEFESLDARFWSEGLF
jgi:hypothetical protein